MSVDPGREHPRQEAAAADRTPRELPREADRERLELFTTLARTGLFLEALQRECLSQHGLAFTEYSVLRLLQRASERRLSPSLLAEKIVCTTGAMTKLVDRLERSDLVERMAAPEDRRGVLVGITEAGDRRAEEAANSYRTGRQRVLDGLDPREADLAHSSLRRLLAVLEQDRTAR